MELAPLLQERFRKRTSQEPLFFHVFLFPKSPSEVEIIPRKVVTKEISVMAKAEPGKGILINGSFATIAVDASGKAGYVIHSESEPFCKETGRIKALGQLQRAHKLNLEISGPGNFYYKLRFKLPENNLRELVLEGLTKFLTQNHDNRV